VDQNTVHQYIKPAEVAMPTYQCDDTEDCCR